jgi:hypothetical protein
LVSLVISVVALIVSFIALKSAKAGGGTTAPVSPKAKVAPQPGAQLEAQLVKMPSDTGHGVIAQDYRIWITNIGTGIAYNVNCDVGLDEPVLFQQEMDEKLYQDMAPGDRVELRTRIGLRTKKVFNVVTYWDTPEGQTVALEHLVSKETD